MRTFDKYCTRINQQTQFITYPISCDVFENKGVKINDKELKVYLYTAEFMTQIEFMDFLSTLKIKH